MKKELFEKVSRPPQRGAGAAGNGSAMKNDNRARARAMTVGSFMAFFLFGVIDVLKGSTLSAVLEETGFSYSIGGFIVMAAYFGFVISSLVTGFISDRTGKKFIVILATLFFLAGIGSYSTADGVPLFIAAFFLIGFGCGSAELGANYIIIDVQRKKQGLYLNLLTAFYGLGSMTAPLYAREMFRAGLTWREVYRYSLIMPFLLLVYFLVARYPRTDDAPPSRLDLRSLGEIFAGPMWWIYLLCLSYVGAEVVVATWLVEYMKVNAGLPIEAGNFRLAAYFAGIMAGRFAGGFFVDRVGYVRSMMAAVVLSMVCILLGVFGPPSLSFLLPASGLFLSIILPTATALVSSMSLKNMGAVLGLFFCFVGLGGMLGPWLAGLVNDWLDVRMGISTAAGFCFLMLVALVFIGRSPEAKQSAAP